MVTFQLSWAKPIPQNLYYEGKMDVKLKSISGSWGTDEDVAKHRGIFILRRTHLLRFRPAPSVIAKGKVQAMWQFASSAVLYHVRKCMWSWTFFRDRGQHRKLYLEYTLRTLGFGPKMSDSDRVLYYELRQKLPSYDIPLYDQLRRRCQKNLIKRFAFISNLILLRS